MELRAVNGGSMGGPVVSEAKATVQTEQPLSILLLFGDDQKLMARADVPAPDEIAEDPDLLGTCRVTIWEQGTGSRIELLGRLGEFKEVFLDMALDLHRLQKEAMLEAAVKIRREVLGDEP